MPTPKKATPAKKTTKAPKVNKVLEAPKVEEVENYINQQPSENPTVIQNSDNNQKNILIVLGVILVAIVLAILLFSQKQSVPGVSHLKEPSSPSISGEAIGDTNSGNGEQEVSDGVVKSGDKIKVDYVGKLEDGTIFDSSIEEFAKKTKNYSASAGRTYEPLEFTVGAGQMIKGFDAGVIGMKVGEKKTIKIAPKDAYGEKTISQTIPSKYLQDNIEQDVPADSFKDVITKTLPAEALGEKGKNVKVGQVIQEGGISGKVTAVDEKGVTLEIKNDSNPFAGKKIVVGATADYQGNTITIKKITPENITVNVLNKQSPFYGKKIVEGLVGKLPNGQDIKIVKINGESTEVETVNPHELAGKTLIFDVEVKAIVK